MSDEKMKDYIERYHAMWKLYNYGYLEKDLVFEIMRTLLFEIIAYMTEILEKRDKERMPLPEPYKEESEEENYSIKTVTNAEEAEEYQIEKAKQEQIIGHCKDCKYFEYDSVAKVDGIPLIVAHENCSRWGEGCKTKEDGYCFLFESQESEKNK